MVHLPKEMCPRKFVRANLSESNKHGCVHFGLDADRTEYEADRFRIGSYLDRIHWAMDPYCI